MRGILLVESHPVAPERADEFNRWYEEVHLAEVVALDGVLSARRFAPLTGDGPYVAVYEIEADDLGSVMTELFAAARDGRLAMSDSMQMDPPPVFRLLELTATYDPAVS